MKNLNFTVMMLLVSILSFGQSPTLNSGTLAPENFQATVHFGAIPANPGLAGENVVWDFSNLAYDPEDNIATIVDPAQTSNYGTYNQANYCVHTNVGGAYNLYAYYIQGDTGIYKLAEGVSDEVSAEVSYLADSKLWLKFPFSYNDTVTDTWQENGQTYTETIVYDGYGTLITPFGTYNNVVRIKEVRPGNTTYTWFSVNPIFQIFEIASQFSLISENIPGQVLHTNEVVRDNQALVYPNPADDVINIKTEFDNAVFRLFDLHGKEIKTADVHKTLQLNTTDLVPGVYIYNISSEDKIVLNGKISIRDK